MARRGENIYKRKDGRYEGRYIRGRNVDGKPLYGYVYAYTYTEVKSILTHAKATSESNRPRRIIGNGSLAEYLIYWLKNIKRDSVKASTYAQYCERVYTHIIPSIGKIPVLTLRREQMQGFVDELGNKGLAPSTVANIYRLLRGSMQKAVELLLTETNPCEGVTLPQNEQIERCVLTRDEQLRLEQVVLDADRSVELSVFLALYTGLRVGEVCALRWRDIDFTTDTLTVRGTLQRIRVFDEKDKKSLLIEGAPKSKRSHRSIPLPSGVVEKLRQYGNDINADSFVLTGDCRSIEPRTIRAAFKKSSAKAGLDVPFHALRHTYATRCLEEHFDPQTLSELLGHSNMSTTMRIYAHSILEHKRLLTKRIVILSESQPFESYPDVS